MTVGGLQSCTWYYVANRASDDNTNLSAIHAERRVRTSCNPGGGGGEHAGRSRTEGHGAQAVHGVTAPLAASGVPGTVLLVETTRTDDGWAVTLRRTTGSADATDFVIEKNETGSWSRTSERFSAPADGQEIALCNLVDGRRVALPSDWEITGSAPSMNNGGQTYALASADHSRLGSLASSIMSDIGTGETIVLRYEVSTSDSEPGSSFITVRRAAGAGALAGRHTPDAQIPARFALHQNTPNPFATSTLIRFDLPRAAETRLEVFDLIGRRIRTLENRALPAGFHVAEWNHLDEAGRPVAPGIYVYRLIAGDFSQRRKMTLTP